MHLKLNLRQCNTHLTDAIFETGASGVPSKSQKSFICGGVRQTITLKSPGKGAPPSTPSWGLQWLPLCWMKIRPVLSRGYVFIPVFVVHITNFHIKRRWKTVNNMIGMYTEGYDCIFGQMGTPAKDTTKLPMSTIRTLGLGGCCPQPAMVWVSSGCSSSPGRF